ncbi:hypothetical protein [Rhizobium leguminosarum]|uniref:hypothetical protein n=1 Tax=Rhizobium leguminosarum TaxID=384 RepID=UPI0013B97163|nr:hypothetical protein [Rhizobium leguminosarum]NEI60969.1 hypothetical protein [Rhizobium leguminosarum]
MHEEKLGRFGHHPDPAIDFEVEVETIQGSLYDVTHGVDHSTTIGEIRNRIAKAMEFSVGGDAGAVAAKQMLRGLEMEAAKHAPSPPQRAPVTDEEFEQWAKLRADDAGHLARELVTYRRNPAPAASAVGSSREAERFRLLARHYMKALGEIAIEDDRDAAQLIACEALGSNPSPQGAATTDLIKALSRLTDNRHSDGVSSLVSPEDRGAIINGCYDLMVASRQAPAPHLVGAIHAIAAERERQVAKGYDAAHDDTHAGGEIIWSEWGAVARINDALHTSSGSTEHYTRLLTQAAAQIAAEIERVERASQTTLAATATEGTP